MSNAIALRSLLSSIILAPALAAAQPWSYDFGDTGGATLPPNTVSTTFFPGTPPGGGTYRARVGGQGGGIALVAPGTSLGSGAEVQLMAATGTSTNKFGVYAWNATGRTAMVGFKLRTTATGNGMLAFNLGNSISASSDNTISGVETQSLALVRLVYTGGELTVDRREGGAYVPVPAGAFAKDTDHDVLLVGNADLLPRYYRHLGEDRVLHAYSWDLYVDGERVSPIGGWPRAGNYNANIDGFSFFGESSPANNAMLMVDDLWHTPELPAAQNVLYHHDFGTATGTFAHPYMAAPPVIAPHLANAGWSNNLGTWNNVNPGVTGRAIGRNVNAGTHTYALALDVDPGHMVRIDDLSFHWDRGTASGVQAWSIAIDDVTVRTGQVVGNDWEWSGMGPIAQPVVVTDGRVDLVITLTGSTANTAFNIDEFRLFGEVLSAGGPLLAVSTFALDLFGPQVVGGSTAAQSFDVSGTDLVPAAGQLTVEAPGGTGFEISLDGVDWATTLQLPYAAATLAPTAVMVRHTPMAPGIQSGLATVQGGGAEPLTVALSGQGVLHAPVTIYHHNFGTQIISGSPYTVSPLATTVPGVLADGLGNSSIASSTGDWGHNGGVTGYGIRMFPGTTDRTVDITVDVAEGLEVEITGFAFWMQRAGGSQHWSVTIEGVPVASGGPVGSGWNPIGPLPVPSVMVTDGQLNMTIHLTEGTTNAGLTFDDLQLFGHVGPAGGDVVWYSQMSGVASDPIWDVVPVGTPGAAVFDPAARAVVQGGHTVLWDAPMALKDLEVEAGGTLRIATGASLALYGSAQVNGTLAGDPGGELALVGDGPVSLVSTAPLDLWHLTVDVPGGAFADADLAVRGTLQLTTGDLTAWGSVTLVSDAEGTGRLGPVGDEADLVGALTQQRYIPAGGTNWRLLGSPVAGRTVADWMDDFYTAGFPGSHWPEFYDTWNGAYAPGAQYWPSVRQFMEQAQTQTIADGLIGVESQNTPLAPGIGFAAWCGDTITGTGAFTVDVTGTPHIARTPMALPVSWTPQTPAAPALQGWNLLSNPLPSPVAFGLMDRGADVANGYYVYDPATGNNAYWDAELGLSVPEQALDGTIQSSQGFWVKADGPDASLAVDEGAKVDHPTGGLFSGDVLPTMGRLHLRLGHAANAMSDEVVVVLGTGTPALEAGDAIKLPVGHVNAPRIAARSSEGVDLMVDRHGAFSGQDAIPVIVRAAHSGQHTITVHAVHTDLSCIMLEDLVTGAVAPLYDGTVYTFHQDSTGQEGVHRFMLHGSAPLPFEVAHGTCGPFSGSAVLEVQGAPVHVTLSRADGEVVQVVPAAQGTVLFTGLDAGNYTIVASTTTLCGDLVHAFTVATSGEPVGLAVSGPQLAAAGEPVTFTADAAPGALLNWSFGDGATAAGAVVQHAYATPGAYMVSVSGILDDCTETAQHAVEVGLATAVGAHPAGDAQVWHADGHFVVEHGHGVLRIDVLDATGRLHLTAPVAANLDRTRMPAAHLGTGIWLVRITSADGQRTVRVPVVR